MKIEDLDWLIGQCRNIGVKGLDNGIRALIPDLQIDILTPPCDFVGAHKNPAIFVNQSTYKYLRQYHDNWILNGTIALKEELLHRTSIEIIGAIVHETGHAFNVAARIPNTEANAFIFEIEAMCKLFASESFSSFGCTKTDVSNYFKSRLPYYKQEVNKNFYLAGLVEMIKADFNLDDNSKIAKNVKSESPWCVMFVHKQCKKELQVMTQRFGIGFESL